MDIIAGTGKSLQELHVALFGPSKAAKAFRAVMKDPKGSADQAALAAVALADLAGSQEFKVLWNADGNPRLDFRSRDPQRPAPFDVVQFAEYNGWMLRDLKKWMDGRLGIPVKRLSKETAAFLRKWVNTNGGRMPQPSREMVQELRPFRLEQMRVCYRGMRFKGIGQMVSFHLKYGKGKAFPFTAKEAASWSTSVKVAERFGRYSSAVSHHDAMLQWLGRFKEQKDYSGTGGYLIGARIQPDDSLVDLSHPDLPEFGFTAHGDEHEVITLPGVSLSTRVYDVFGNPQHEVEEFQKSYKNVSPMDKNFYLDYLSGFKPVVRGDTESGTITYERDPADTRPVEKTPRKLMEDGYSNPISNLSESMYDAKWVSEDTIRYERMSLSGRVASRYLRFR